MKLNNFFDSKSIAIIGASKNKEKLGFQILHNIKVNSFKGKIYPINLKERIVDGFKVFDSISKLKGKVDLAVIAIPSQFVVNEVKKCAQAKIKNIIIITAGFSEDSKEGVQKEEEIKVLAKKYNLNILGPNCLGLIDTDNNLNATFASAKNKKGNIAFLSQSGAICSAVLDWAQDKNIGFSKFVSLGNKSVLDENDFFEYFIQDKQTSFVAAYLEEIKDGEKFMKIASKLSRIKPLVILKAGQSKAGQKAAMSHTGSLAGSHEAIKAGFRRAGIIEVDTIEEMFDLAKIYQRDFQVKNDKIFIVSNAGGPMVITVDQFSRVGLELGNFSKTTEKKLRDNLPSIVKVKNPMDIIGDAKADRYKKSLEIILKDRNISNLLVLLTPQSSTEVCKTAQIIVSLQKRYKNKLIMVSFIGGVGVQEGRDILDKAGVINFDFPSKAVFSFAKIINYEVNKNSIKLYKYSGKKLLSTKSEQVDFIKSMKILRRYGISVVKNYKIKNEKDLNKLKYPIAMKVTGKNLIHKTDKKAVRANISDIKEAKKVFRGFRKLLKDSDNYCLSQPMTSGTEIILGFKRDKSFGPIIMVGQGGVYTEVLKDIQIEVGDVDIKRAQEMIKNLKIYPILKGIRGQSGVDIKSLAKAIIQIAKIALENPDIQELDINPLFVSNKGIIAVDVRIII